MNAPLPILLDGLSMRFTSVKKPALAALSTTIAAGRITGLVGPDGAGKTTLMRLLAGLLQPTSGQINIDGHAPYDGNPALRLLIGYMPQQFGLYEDLTVLENLNLYADLRSVLGNERRARFTQLLSFTDLTRFQDRPAGKLSGGMKQKLGLACALLGNPRILLLDEPGVGVDPISRRELWKMVSELASNGMTVLWSTAYLDEAELCDEVHLMNDGEIIASGTPQMLMHTMQGRCVQLVGISQARRAVLRRVLAAPEVIDGAVQGDCIRMLVRTAGERPDLALLDAGQGAHFRDTEPRLEDAFISLLGGGPGGESALAAVMPEAHLPDTVSANAVIEARSLTRRFGDFIATDSVSFTVKRGEIFGLLGPNGAGKSTTFKMECGLLNPSEGQALVMGLDLKSSPSAARQQLGYMAQKFSLYTQLTVRQNLDFFSGIYGLSGQRQREKIDAMVTAFALGPYLGSVTANLPLGFKQRLALACAVMHEPPILFLDEPTSGVDPITRREFWAHINGLADRGVTVLVTTHFMDEAEYCDRIALIFRGKMIAMGTPDELKRICANEALPNPSMEDTFIALVQGAGL